MYMSLLKTLLQSTKNGMVFLSLSQEKMFQFWFNTFFVGKDDYSIPFQYSNGKTPTMEGLSVSKQLNLTLSKAELDKANKDKSHRFFSPNFKVFIHPCWILNVRDTYMAYARVTGI